MKKFLMMICLSVATMGVSYAQGGPDASQEAPETLSLQQAIDIALSDNPTITVGNKEVERFKYVYNQAVSSLYPQIEVSAQYALALRRQEMMEGFSFGGKNTFNVAGNLALPLFVPSVYRQMKMVGTQEAAAMESLRASKIELIASVRAAYYSALMAQESLSVIDEAIETTQQVVDETKLMFNNGLATKYDTLTADVQLENLKSQRIQAVNGVEITILQLKMLLSIPEEQNIRVVGTLDDYCMVLYNDAYNKIIDGKATGEIAEVCYDDMDDEEIMKHRKAMMEQREVMNTNLASYTATIMDVTNKKLNGGSAEDMQNYLGQNTTLRTIDFNSDLLTHQEKLIQTTRMPTVAAFASISYIGQERVDLSGLMGGGAAGGARAAMTRAAANQSKFWWQYPINVGAQISIPIFSGLKKTNQIQEVRNQQQQLNMQREYAVEGIRLQLQQAVNNLVAAQQSMTSNSKTMEQAFEAFTIANARFSAGAGTMLELNSAQLSYVQSQLNYTQAVYNYLTAYAEYRKVLGVDVEVENTENKRKN